MENYSGSDFLDTEEDRIKRMLADPDMQRKAMEMYFVGSPEQKALTEEVASQVDADPSKIPQIAATVAPNAVSADVTPTGKSPRMQFMEQYERRRADDKKKFADDTAALDAGKENAKWSDFANQMISTFGRVSAAYGGDDKGLEYYRNLAAKQMGQGVRGIDEKKAELIKWLKEKQGMDNAEFTTGLRSLDSEGKENIELGRLDLAKLLGANTVTKTASDMELGKGKLDQGGVKLEIDQARLDLDKQKAADATRLKEQELALRTRLRLNNKGELTKEDRAKAKRDALWAREDEELFLEGFHLRPGRRPLAQEAMKVRKSQGDFVPMEQDINELTSLIEKHGTENIPGKIKVRMKALATNIMMVAKNESNFGLGVLAGPDMAILGAALPDATDASWENILSYSNPAEALKVSLNSARNKFKAKAWSSGYEPNDAKDEMGTKATAQSAMVNVQQKGADGKLGPVKPVSRKAAEVLIKSGKFVEAH